MQVFLFSSSSYADRFLVWVMTWADGGPHGISPGLDLLGDPKDFAQSRGTSRARGQRQEWEWGSVPGTFGVPRLSKEVSGDRDT